MMCVEEPAPTHDGEAEAATIEEPSSDSCPASLLEEVSPSNPEPPTKQPNAEKLGSDGNMSGWALLMHAKIYSFAHQNAFDDLSKLALQRLTAALEHPLPKPTSLFPYLAEAVKHIYDTMTESDDPARKVLSQYLSSNYANLDEKSVRALMQYGGEMMVDISINIVASLSTKESKISSLEAKVDTLSKQVMAFRNSLKQEIRGGKKFRASHVLAPEPEPECEP